MLLCSTDDQVTRDTWAHLGFSFTSREQLAALGVGEGDLLHMDNTVQMHKQVCSCMLRATSGSSLRVSGLYCCNGECGVLHMNNTMKLHMWV